MEGKRYGKWTGLWLTAEEAATEMLHVTDSGEQPITKDGVREGDILHDKMTQSCVFEVFLYDHVRDRVFLTEV